MGYSTFKSSSKALTTSEQIGPGQIQLSHLDSGLFTEIQKISLHNHSGVGSRRVSIRNLEGDFGSQGFFMFSSDGSKRYHVTIDSATDLFVLTPV